MNTYSLNQNSIPQAPMNMAEHHRLLNMLVILCTAGLIIGLLYWWSTAGLRQAAPVTQSDVRAQVAELLSSSNIKVSQEQIDAVSAQLSASKATVTDTQKQAVARSLQEM